MRDLKIGEYHLVHMRSRDTITPIAREQEYMMDYKQGCFSTDIFSSGMRTFFRPRAKFTVDFI